MEGKSPKEIQETIGCSASTVTVAKKRLAERQTEIDDSNASDYTDVDEYIDSFVKKIKIEPDTEVLTKDKPKENEDTDYECPSCGHEWNAPKNEHQIFCANCGMEFE